MNIKNLPAIIIIVAFSILLIRNSPGLCQEETKYSYTFKGEITNKDPRYNPIAVLEPAEVKKLLVEMAKSPMTEEEVKSWLSSSQTQIDDLLRVEIIKMKDGLYSINFPFYFAKDIAIIRNVADKYGKILAENILKKKDPIYSLLDRVKPSSVGQDKLAFIILGAMALDIGALDFLSEKHYIMTDVERPGGNRYVFSAQEVTDFSKKEMYWGCHSQGSGEFVFLTFGDHDPETERNGFPDIVWGLGKKITSLDIPDLYRKEFLDINRGFLMSMVQTAANILLNLKELPMTLDELINKAFDDKNEVKPVLDLLVKLRYVSTEEGKYVLTCPVLSEADREIVEEIREIVFQEILAWNEAYYETIQNELHDISPLKNNMDFRQMFWVLWHYFFGSANMHLAHSGFIYDTYKAPEGFKGYLQGVVTSSIWK